MSIRVCIVDDHAVVRRGLKTVLEEEPDIEILEEGESAADALRLAESHQPDAMLLDLTLPDRNGLEVVRDLKRASPETAVIVLTIHDSELFLVDAMSSGASGYLLKDSSHRLIPLAIRSAVASGCVLEKRMLSGLLRTLPRMMRQGSATPQGSERLSERELEILRLIAKGSGNRIIADQLHLAESTVKKYVQSLKTKLGVSDRAEAAVLGLRLGLVD